VAFLHRQHGKQHHGDGRSDYSIPHRLHLQTTSIVQPLRKHEWEINTKIDWIIGRLTRLFPNLVGLHQVVDLTCLRDRRGLMAGYGNGAVFGGPLLFFILHCLDFHEFTF